MSVPRIPIGDTEPIVAVFLDPDGEGVTGLSPRATIRRADGDFWDGVSSYAAAPTLLTMTEVDATNRPGEYAFDFDTTNADVGWHGVRATAASSPPWPAGVENPLQDGELHVGTDAISDAVWDEPTAGHTSGGTFGAENAFINAGFTSVLSNANANATAILNALSAAEQAILDAIAALVGKIVAAVKSIPGIARRLATEDVVRTAIPYKTDLWVRLIAPVDEETGDPIDATEEGAAAEFRVFDALRSEILSADEATGQTVLSVTNAGAFAGAETGTVEVDLDDGTVHASTLNSVDTDAGEITLAAGLPSGASAGARVRVRLGAPVTMAEFGTPARVSASWGFQGLLPDDHPGLSLDRPVDIEIGFVGLPGGGAHRLRTLFAIVSRRAENVAAESSGAIVPVVKAHSTA